MKRKFLSGLMAVTMSAFLLSGCSEEVTAGNTTGNNSETVAETPETDNEGESAEATVAKAEDTAEETTENAAAEEVNVPALRDCVPKKMGCRIGCSATLSELQDPQVFNIVTTHFDSITFGNELKPDSLFGYSNGSCPGTKQEELNGEIITVPVMDYSRPEKMLDMIYDWNEANPDRKIMVRGHVLVWHSQTPEWFFHEDYDKKNPYVDKETMNKRLEWYIKTVLTHFTGDDSKYKDMFYGWDVVNEAISDATGKYRTDSENSEPLSNDTHGSNSSWWHVYGSNEYIINAFKFANKYAPETLELYYNDYNETVIKKMNGIKELLQTIKDLEGERGVGTRITAMGLQGHYQMEDPNANSLEVAMKEYGKIVGEVQITELDLRASSDYDGSDEAKVEEYEKQRKRYNMLYYSMGSANNTPDTTLTGITFWGTVDKYSWLQTANNVGGGNSKNSVQCPLLFDDNYQPKPCFFVFGKED